MSQITPNLFVGSLHESFDSDFLDANGITHILNVAEEIDIVERVGRTYRKISITDDDMSADINLILDQCMEFITLAHGSKGVVMVHCLEGISRSVCVCLAYVIKILEWDSATALNDIRSFRNQIDPFPLYLEQTMKWTKK
jgi:protein-tyrosine phosphatase